MPLDYEAARERMVAEQLVPRGIRDQRVLAAMAKVPRHRFVEREQTEAAYADRPLPIGEGQTISQPYIVALMTQALELAGEEKVLEIGTGSGYQAALLAELSAHLYTVEKYPSLLERCRGILEELGYTNITAKVDDGTQGWPEESPFDAIMVTAGAPHAPEPLLHQLAEGGRMLIPIGDRVIQDLVKITKKEGRTVEENLGGCRFVPLRGADGWR